MSVQEIVETMAAAFKADPRNKIYVAEDLLIAGVAEETGNTVPVEKLRQVIVDYLNGNLDEEDEAIYDGAAYACGVAARHCFADDPDEDLDYEIVWLEEGGGSYVAEVRPS